MSGKWTKIQRENFAKSIAARKRAAKKAEREGARQQEIPLDMIPVRETRRRVVAVNEAGKVMDVSIEAGSKITMTIGGVTVRFRALEREA